MGWDPQNKVDNPRGVAKEKEEREEAERTREENLETRRARRRRENEEGGLLTRIINEFKDFNDVAG